MIISQTKFKRIVAIFKNVLYEIKTNLSILFFLKNLSLNFKNYNFTYYFELKD